MDTTSLPIRSLRLDHLNPRLPAEVQSGESYEALIQFIDRAYEPIVIARSIAEHGYFESEPLIAVEEEEAYVVVEGNRRLVALLGLTDGDVRELLEMTQSWEELAARASVPEEVPVVLMETRRDVAPIIGFRHISGIAPWEPFAKARFIAQLVDQESYSFAHVASLVGEQESDVRQQYRNYRIVEQAEEDFQLDTSGVKSGFGVFTRAMSSAPLREHIGAPPPSEVQEGSFPVPEDRGAEAEELLDWLFGADDPPVIGESRDITRLGEAIGSDEGLAVLRGTRDLAQAHEAAGGHLRRLSLRLARAAGYLESALEDIDEYRDQDDIQSLIDRCQAALAQLTPKHRD